jgi:thiol:disulfide interchange protein DsbD
MKHWLYVILFSLLTSFSAISLHAGENASTNTGASLFTDGSKEEEFLSPDVAFKLDINAQDAQHLTASFKIEPGYYLYRERIKFVLAPGSRGSLTSIELPQGDIKTTLILASKKSITMILMQK